MPFKPGQSGNPEKQFQSGKSGNPAGKPKGTKHISTWIQDMLNDEEFEMLIPDKVEGWRKEKGAPIKAIVRTALIKAQAGDQRWADWLAKYGYGQKVVHANDTKNPLTNPAEKSLVDAFIEKLKDDTADQTKSD